MYDTEKTPLAVMKLGVKNALTEGKKTVFENPPICREGQILIPTASLPSAAKAVSAVTVDNVEYVCTDKIENLYCKYDSMGLILLDTDKSVTEITRANDIDYLLKLANRFVYDIEENIDWVPNQYAPATDADRAVFKKEGRSAAKLLRENSPCHPYIFANAEKLAKLKAAYLSDEDTALKGYIGKLVERARKILSKECYALNDSGDGLASPIENTCTNDGYDAGGRHGVAESHANETVTLAFAYRMTGEEAFARVAYYVCLSIGDFAHWGPGHFLNCAGAASFMAITYDWLCGAWAEMKLNAGLIKKIIFEKGVHQGFNSAILDRCDFPSAKQGTGWRFKAKADNWNAVCNGGLLVANLALLTESPDEYVGGDALAEAEELLGANLCSLTGYGLVMKQYAPDGSYVESAGYWSYGTNTLMRAMAALHSALGTDLGLHNAPGFDKTFYYAMHSESSDFVTWNYHDGHLNQQDTSMFNVFATISGDNTLFSIRESHLERGKGPQLYDLLYHPSLIDANLPDTSDIPLDHYMEGIDALTVRSSWDKGALYAGLIGGYNPAGGSHNHVDSGAFVYHNKGIIWLTDLGADNYNIKGGYFGNYGLYRRNAEGHNVIFLKSLPYGQVLNATGTVESVRTGGSSHIVINNKAVYGEENTVYGRRGMLYCNDRKTVVIQDEIAFNNAEDVCFAAHFKSSEITAEISDSGREITLTHKDGEKIKLRALGDGGKFRITSCYDFLLSGSASFEGEHSREEYSRILMEFNEAVSVNFAMVIEGEEELGYPEIIPMENW